MVRISHGVKPFPKFCFADYLHKIQKALPDVSGERLLSLCIGTTFVFIWI